MDALKAQAAALLPPLKELKDTLHRMPELSLVEHKTTALLREKLSSLGLELIDTGLETGVVALLTGALAGDTIALRADIDAIAGEEDTSHAIRSQNAGAMHACGHDFHTACLYGAALLLSERRESLKGRVAFLFQPAEENTRGAAALLQNGLWERIGGKPSAVFGLHNRPELLKGEIAVKEGPLMAGKTNFKVTISGVSGHGGSPHKCVDPVMAGAALINAVQTIVSRSTDPLDALVCAVHGVHTDAPDFFVPSSLTLSGSIRYLSDAAHETACEKLEAMALSIAEAYGCTAKPTLMPQVPVTQNPPALTKIALIAAEATVGGAGVICPPPDMGSEDFSLYGLEAPAFFYWLGSGFEGGKNAAWHNPSFETDDFALPLGAELLTRSVLLTLGAKDA